MEQQGTQTKGPAWLDQAMAVAWERAGKIKAARLEENRFTAYQDNPVGFCAEVLGDHFTPEIERVFESVVSNPVTEAQSANAIGKSHMAARAAVWFYLTHPQAQVYLTAAPPERNLNDNIWAHIANMMYTKPGIFTGHRMGRMKISRNKLSFLEGVTIPMQGTREQREAKFSGKHAPQLMFIVDEGDAVPDEVYRGIESCMSSEFVRLLILFNPRAQMGPVWDKAEKGMAKVVAIPAFSHPNVTTGNDVIPGAVSRSVTVRRINEWTRPLAPDEVPKEGQNVPADYVEIPSFLEGVVAQAQDGGFYPPLGSGYRKVTQNEFWYMVMGKYPPQGTRQLLSEEWIKRAVDRRKLYVAMNGDIPPAEIKPILGIDCAEYGGDSNTCCPRYGGFVGAIRRWSGLDADQNADFAWALYKQYNADCAMVDALGVGASVAPRMARIARSEQYKAVIFPVKVSEKPTKMTQSDLGEFFSIRDECAWRFREWLEKDPTAMLPDDALLLEELRAITYEYVEGSGKIKIVKKETLRDRLKRSPDSADGLMLTFAPYTRAKAITAQQG